MDQNNRIENKIDKLDERLDSVDKHLAVYNAQLEIHIKRTEALEKRVEPIEKTHIMAETIWKITLVLSAVIAFAIGTIISIFK